MVYIDGYKKHSYLLWEQLMVDYKKLVFIMDIKVNTQYFISIVLPNEKELVTQS